MTERPDALNGRGRHTDPGGSGVPEDAWETSSVRPYAVTGGRVKAASKDLPIEALVEVLTGAVPTGLTPEKRAIVQHAAHTFVSVAELSALLRLPLGIVRVVVTDLADDGYIRVHSSTPVSTNTGQIPALSLSVLESVLNGISAL